VTRTGGFAEPVHVLIEARYLALFEEVSPQPEPAASRTSLDGTKVEMTFDPPAGDTLHVDLSRRAHPSARFRQRAEVQVTDEAGRELVSVRFSTFVIP
jgi:hypothetical protein